MKKCKVYSEHDIAAIQRAAFINGASRVIAHAIITDSSEVAIRRALLDRNVWAKKMYPDPVKYRLAHEDSYNMTVTASPGETAWSCDKCGAVLAIRPETHHICRTAHHPDEGFEKALERLDKAAFEYGKCCAGDTDDVKARCDVECDEVMLAVKALRSAHQSLISLAREEERKRCSQIVNEAHESGRYRMTQSGGKI